MNKNQAVLVFGSFDMLHQGHRYFLKSSRKHGQYLWVVLARDEEIVYFKQRSPAWNFEQRKAALIESGLVDQVISSDTQHGTFYVLQNSAKIDKIVLGDGQESLAAALETFFLANEELRCPINYIAPYHRRWHSSTRRHQLRLLLAHIALFGALLFWASGWVIYRIIATSGLAPPLATTLRMSLLAFFFFFLQIISCYPKIRKQQKKRSFPPNKPSEIIWLKEHTTNTGNQLNNLSIITSIMKAEFALDRTNLAYLLLSGLSFSVYNLCYFYGLHIEYASQGGILNSVLIPCFSAILYSYSHKAPLQRSQILGLMLGILSGLIQIGGLSYLQNILGTQLNSQNYWQSILFIGTAFSWSLITLFSSKLQESYSLQKYSFYTYLFSALWTSWGWFWLNSTIEIEWVTLLILVFISNILGTSLYFLALRFLRPNHVASFLFLNPIFILLLSYILLAEPWTIELGIASVLAVLAIILINKKRR